MKRSFNGRRFFARAGLQRPNRFLGRGVGAVGSAVLEVVETFGQMPVNEPLRDECDLAVLDPGFQKVPNVQAHLLADALWYHDLKFR